MIVGKVEFLTGLSVLFLLVGSARADAPAQEAVIKAQNGAATLETAGAAPDACANGGAGAQPAEPLETNIPSCSDDNQSQTQFLAGQALKLINGSREYAAHDLSCLLGRTITGPMVTDAVANITKMLCHGGPDSPFRAVVNGNSSGSTAEFDPNPPDGYNGNSAFHGTLMFGTLPKTTRDRGNMVDSLIHENVHAVVRYLSVKYNMTTEPKSKVCNLPSLRSAVMVSCDAETGSGDQMLTPPMRVPFDPGEDRRFYQPGGDCVPSHPVQKENLLIVAKPAKGDAVVKQFGSNSGMCPDGVKHCYQVKRKVTEQEPDRTNDIYSAYDDHCNPDGKFRNEIAARDIAAVIAGGRNCKTAYPQFFEYSEWRKP